MNAAQSRRMALERAEEACDLPRLHRMRALADAHCGAPWRRDVARAIARVERALGAERDADRIGREL